MESTENIADAVNPKYDAIINAVIDTVDRGGLSDTRAARVFSFRTLEPLHEMLQLNDAAIRSLAGKTDAASHDQASALITEQNKLIARIERRLILAFASLKVARDGVVRANEQLASVEDMLAIQADLAYGEHGS